MTAVLPAFALASTLLIVAPGPDSLLVLRNTLRLGRRAGWVTAGGTLSGLLAWAAAAAFGLSALLRVSHLGYDALRLAGAGYLIWLGVNSLAPFRRGHSRPGAAAMPAGRGPAQLGARVPQRAAVQPVQSQDRCLLHRFPARLRPCRGPHAAAAPRARAVVHHRNR